MRTLVLLSLFSIIATGAAAMSADGCGAGACTDCHSLTKSEAGQILGEMVTRVNKVDLAEVPGMWMVEVEQGGKKLPVFIDFSKKYLVTGSIIRITDRTNVSQQSHARMNTIDVSRIPVEDALLLGSPRAQQKVIVFTDPECPYCRKLHAELKEVVRRAPEIAFLIKLMPLKMHPNAYDISRSIVCNDSLELLEASFASQPVPPPLCETRVVDETLALVRELGIRSTPTLVMPNGMVISGYKKADDLLDRIGQNLARAELR